MPWPAGYAVRQSPPDWQTPSRELWGNLQSSKGKVVAMGEAVADVLRRVIAKAAHLDLSSVTPDSALSQLGVTSLDLVEIIMTIEDEYDITIPVDAAEAWNNYKTVADLIDLGRSLGLEGRSCAT